MADDSPLLQQIAAALAAVKLEAIFVGDCAEALRGGLLEPASIELFLRDTPLHRKRVHALAKELKTARVPLSEDARTIKLVGLSLLIDLIFGQRGEASYASVRAKAGRVQIGGATALVAAGK